MLNTCGLASRAASMENNEIKPANCSGKNEKIKIINLNIKTNTFENPSLVALIKENYIPSASDDVKAQFTEIENDQFFDDVPIDISRSSPEKSPGFLQRTANIMQNFLKTR